MLLLYVFVLVKERGELASFFTTYDLDNQKWSGNPTELEVPPNTGAVNAILEQSFNDREPPRMAIHASFLYVHSLNREGQDWQQPRKATESDESEGEAGADSETEGDWGDYRVATRVSGRRGGPAQIGPLHAALAYPHFLTSITPAIFCLFIQSMKTWLYQRSST